MSAGRYTAWADAQDGSTPGEYADKPVREILGGEIAEDRSSEGLPPRASVHPDETPGTEEAPMGQTEAGAPPDGLSFQSVDGPDGVSQGVSGEAEEPVQPEYQAPQSQEGGQGDEPEDRSQAGPNPDQNGLAGASGSPTPAEGKREDLPPPEEAGRAGGEPTPRKAAGEQPPFGGAPGEDHDSAE